MARKPKSADPNIGPTEDEAATSEAGAEPREVAYTSSDGLTLRVRDYGDTVSPFLPVVCLPGLTRTARDFDPLARFLSAHRHRPRRVVAFDYRGRGRSDRDANHDNYNPLTEMTDVLDGMAALGIPRAAIVGTSRGGIIAMLMAVARPAALAGLVLNDIGPVLEPHGLARIKTYVGRTPAPDSWSDAVAILKRLHGAQFTGLGEDDWEAFARTTWRDDNGRPVADYDRALAGTLDGVEFDRPVPTLWDQFRALAVPVLAIRGENSDLLSIATLSAMAAAHPRFESLTVAGEGHAPLLRQPSLLQRISAFITGIEGSGPPVDAVIPREVATYDLDNPTPRQGGEAEPA